MPHGPRHHHRASNIGHAHPHHHGHPIVPPQQHAVSSEAVNSLAQSSAYTNASSSQHHQPALNPAATHFNTMGQQQTYDYNDASDRFFPPTMAEQQQMLRQQGQQHLTQQQMILQRQRLIAQQQQLPMNQRAHINPIAHFNNLDAMNGIIPYPTMHQQQDQITNDTNHYNLNQNIPQQHHLNHRHSNSNSNSNTDLYNHPAYHNPYLDEISLPTSTHHSSQYATPDLTPSQPHNHPLYTPHSTLLPFPYHSHGIYLSTYPTPPSPMRTILEAKTHLAALEHYKKSTIVTEAARASPIWRAQKAAIEVRDVQLQGQVNWADHPDIMALEDRMEEVERWCKRIGMTWERVSEEIEEMYGGIAMGEYE